MGVDETQQADVPVATAVPLSGTNADALQDVQQQTSQQQQQQQQQLTVDEQMQHAGAVYHVDAEDKTSTGSPCHFGCMFIIMSSRTKRTRWVPPRNMTAVAIMSGIKLDFTHAEFVHRVCKVNVVAIMGGVEIVVPPGVHVVNTGLGICGGFDSHVEDRDGSSIIDKPTIVLRGVAIMGGADAKVDLSSPRVRIVRQPAP